MNKKQVQMRVSQNGKKLALNKFIWCEKTNTFSSKESNLVLDFMGTNNCTFNTGSDCTFKTGSNCTFKTWYGCTFKTWSDCVIVNRNVFEVITPKEGQLIQICPYSIPGHLVDSMYNGELHIIADGILSKIVNQKGDVYKVVNHGEEKETWLVKSCDTYSHGKTLEEARNNLIYKISDRDKSEYKNLTLKSTLSKDDVIVMYRTITGACASGTKYFVDQNADKIKDEYTVKEIIELTKGQFGNDTLRKWIA